MPSCPGSRLRSSYAPAASANLGSMFQNPKRPWKFVPPTYTRTVTVLALAWPSPGLRRGAPEGRVSRAVCLVFLGIPVGNPTPHPRT